jgi:sulfide dehydrogenase cytochrome subunit
MKKKTLLALCAALCSGTIGQLALAEDLTVNRLLASQCAQCHGTNGYASGDMDGLDDESMKDLIEDLTDMQSEDRPGDIMDHQALGYSDDQIRRIAHFYGSLAGKVDEQPESGNGSGNGDESEEHESESESEKREDEARDERRKKRAEATRERARKKKEREKDDD